MADEERDEREGMVDKGEEEREGRVVRVKRKKDSVFEREERERGLGGRNWRFERERRMWWW